MADFPTSPRPSYPIQETATSPEVLISKHKDGSEQRRLKGAGTKRTFVLSFGSSLPITNSERQAIETHWIANSTLHSFHWTHPERGETILARYLEAPSFNHVGYDAYEGQVKLQEVPS